MPKFSIILPTYNRAEIIGRAIASVRQQTFQDWELIVVDDGSLDDTVERIDGLDDRIRILHQPHGGVYVARNAGLFESRGHLITFLDSDDAWLPHFLELTAAFLKHSPQDHFVTTEFLEDWGSGPLVRHDVYEIGTKYPADARAIGSRMLELPAGEIDDYLRVYETREEIGDWGREIAIRVGAPHAMLYRGHIFEQMRWGYLNWLPITVLTRHALEVIGPFTTHTRSAADYRFLCRLARNFCANMIAIPSAIKHDKAAGARKLAEEHLATGTNAYQFEVNKLSFFEELYWKRRPGDAEIALLRRHYSFDIGRSALRLGRRENSITYLRSAASVRPRLWRAYPLLALAHMIPSDLWSSRAYRVLLRVQDVGRRFMARELSVTELAKKIAARIV